MSITTTAWHHLRRSPFQSLTAFLVMFLNLTTVSAFLLLSLGTSKILNYFQSVPEINIYLKDTVTKEQLQNLKLEISGYAGVKEIKEISKEKALELYQEMNKDKPLLLDMVTSSLLPASLEVSATNQNVLADIAQNFQNKTDLIDEIIYPKDIIQTLSSITTFLRQTGTVIISFLTITSFLLILSTISLKATNRKEEIKISRLLGATEWYVKAPFILEGAYYGLLSSTVACLLSFICLYYLQNPLNAFFKEINLIQLTPIFVLQIYSILLSYGVAIGVFASWVAVKKQIKF